METSKKMIIIKNTTLLSEFIQKPLFESTDINFLSKQQMPVIKPLPIFSGLYQTFRFVRKAIKIIPICTLNSATEELKTISLNLSDHTMEIIKQFNSQIHRNVESILEYLTILPKQQKSYIIVIKVRDKDLAGYLILCIKIIVETKLKRNCLGSDIVEVDRNRICNFSIKSFAILNM